jgi:phage-related holin
VIWIFLSGGVLHLYNTNDPVTFGHFMKGAGIYFFRFLKLAVIAGLFYWLIYFYLIDFLGDLVQEYTREVIDERIAFLWMLVKYLVVLIFLIFVNLIVDYTKIITVTKRQRSILLAIVESFRFVLGNVGRTLSLYVVIGLLGVCFLCLYGLLAPGGLQYSWIGIIWALALGQIYILSRIWIRLLFMASQSALCRTIGLRQHLS